MQAERIDNSADHPHERYTHLLHFPFFPSPVRSVLVPLCRARGSRLRCASRPSCTRSAAAAAGRRRRDCTSSSLGAAAAGALTERARTHRHRHGHGTTSSDDDIGQRAQKRGTDRERVMSESMQMHMRGAPGDVLEWWLFSRAQLSTGCCQSVECESIDTL